MKRKYSLFVRPKGQRKWDRISARCYELDKAIRYYQSALMGFVFQGVSARIRVVTGPACITQSQCLALCLKARSDQSFAEAVAKVHALHSQEKE